VKRYSVSQDPWRHGDSRTTRPRVPDPGPLLQSPRRPRSARGSWRESPAKRSGGAPWGECYCRCPSLIAPRTSALVWASVLSPDPLIPRSADGVRARTRGVASRHLPRYDEGLADGDWGRSPRSTRRPPQLLVEVQPVRPVSIASQSTPLPVPLTQTTTSLGGAGSYDFVKKLLVPVWKLSTR
jgi:hypothetical protein